ncbi:MAG: SurA N-terminal domain-containing protein [Alphaproteobacteria bacterium]|nr:SurA N-terminal domain-containing protein [Alphaproteobacteria bacterium]
MNFQSGIGGWMVKILLVLLIISFAIWGIEDMLFGQARQVNVASIGSQQITSQMLGQEVSREEERLRTSFGRALTPEMIQSMNLEAQVLEQMIARNLLHMEATELGIIPSETDLLNTIRSNPSFQNAQGQFDKNQFLLALRRNGLTEKDYLAQLKQSLATEILLATIQRTRPSKAELDFLYQAMKQSRSGTLYTLSQSSIPLDPPTQEALETYHREHSAQFMTPELRSASYVVIHPKDLEKDITVSSADLEAIYKQRLDEFKRGERREVSQLLFDSKEKATAAYQLLREGKSFSEAARASGNKDSAPVVMGLVEKSKLPAEAAEEVFALVSDSYTAPIQSAFGWHIFKVTRIDPPRTLRLDEVKTQLEQEARQSKLEQTLSSITNHLEDTLASGSSLPEAAAAIGLSVRTLAPVDRQGRGKDGEPAKDVPDLERFLEVLFSTEEKTESSVRSSKGGDLYVLRVESVQPEALRPLAEIRKQVTDALLSRQRQEKLSALAADISAKFNNPAERAALVRQHQLKQSRFEAVRRNDDRPAPPPSLLNELFDRRVNEATAMAENDTGDWVIAVLDRIEEHTSPPLEADYASLRRSAEESSSDEMIRQYLAYLRKKHNVTIDDQALASLRQAP